MEEVGLETRWIILGTDGRHITLARHSDPSPAALAEAEAGLQNQGLSGWLAIMKGSYYARQRPSLMMVRSLGAPNISFDLAVETFQATRAKSLANINA